MFAVICQPPPPGAPFHLGEVVEVDDYTAEVDGPRRLSDHSLLAEFWPDRADAARRAALAVAAGGINPGGH